MRIDYATILLIATFLLAFISFSVRMADASPKYRKRGTPAPKNQLKRRAYNKKAQEFKKERLRKLREKRDRARRARERKRTLRENFQVRPKIKSKNPKPQPKVRQNLNRNTPKIHKNPKKPLTKGLKCNKVCQYHKLRFMMMMEAAHDYRDSHKGFKRKTRIKKRKKN